MAGSASVRINTPPDHSNRRIVGFKFAIAVAGNARHIAEHRPGQFLPDILVQLVAVHIAPLDPSEQLLHILQQLH